MPNFSKPPRSSSPRRSDANSPSAARSGDKPSRGRRHADAGDEAVWGTPKPAGKPSSRSGSKLVSKSAPRSKATGEGFAKPAAKSAGRSVAKSAVKSAVSGKPTLTRKGIAAPAAPSPAPSSTSSTSSTSAAQAKAAATKSAPSDGKERIQKWLASAGIASRRTVEAWIAEGRVTVNGEPAQAGHRVGAKDKIAVDGRPIRIANATEKTRVLLYKKRTGEIVTRDDPEGRRTVFRKLPELAIGRWIAVGRLDINTSGLLLLTNDGELARRLMHPSFELTRTYAVRVLGLVDDAVITRLKRGVELEDGPARFNSVERVDGREFDDEEGAAANRWFKVTVREGRNRLVRRLLESQELQVSRLIRIGYGPVELGSGIKSGSYRELERDEVKAVMKAVQLEKQRAD